MAESLYKGGPSVEEVRSQVEVDHIYKLSSNENALGPSPRVVEAIHKAVADLHVYPPREDDSLRDHIAAYLGQGLDRDHIYSGNSGSEVVELLNRAFVQAGDEVIVSSPTFGLYKRLAVKLDLTLVDVPLHPETFAHDIKGLIDAVTERTRLLYICNPNNPTGTILLRREMEALLDALPERVIVVADEVYHDFVDHPDYPNSIQSVLDGRNLIVVHSFSKAFAMAGMRLGYAISRPDIVRAVRHFRCPFHLNALADAAGHAALNDHDHRDRTRAMVKEGKAFLAAEFDRLGVRYWPSYTNFMLIKPELPAEEVQEKLLKQGFMVRPTNRNGLPGGLRITIGTPEANRALIQVLEVILQS